jgi:hypothetical protein
MLLPLARLRSVPGRRSSRSRERSVPQSANARDGYVDDSEDDECCGPSDRAAAQVTVKHAVLSSHTHTI